MPLREALRLRFRDGLTVVEAGKALGISGQAVSQRERKAVTLLRAQLAARGSGMIGVMPCLSRSSWHPVSKTATNADRPPREGESV